MVAGDRDHDPPDSEPLCWNAVGNGLQLWDVATGRELNRLVEDAPWTRARFSPDGRGVVALGADGAVWWWDLAGLR